MRLHLPTLALLGLVAGVAVASWLPPLFVYLTFIALAAIVFPFRRIDLVVVCVFVALGAGRMAVMSHGRGTLGELAGESRRIEGVIVRHESSAKGEQATLSRLVVDGRAYRGLLLLRTLPYVDLPLGARVQVSCLVKAPEAFDGFAYDRYLHAKNIWATCDAKTTPFIDSSNATRSPAVAIRRFHDVLAKAMDRSFGDPQSALLRGLLIGDNAFSDEWKEIFRQTGTSHMVAASGSNVTLVASLAFGLLIGFGLHRRHAVPLLIASIWAFAVIAGLGAAVTRAAVMSSIVFVARETRRVTAPWRPLLLAVVLMLAVNPRLLRDDVGFQLSVLATLGLLIWTRPIEAKLKFMPEEFGLREALASTLAATFGTLPTMLFSFDSFSVVAPLANLFVLPWIPSAMLVGAIGTFLATMLPPIAPFVTIPGHLILSVMTTELAFFGHLPFATVAIPLGIKLSIVAFWLRSLRSGLRQFW